MNGLSIIIPCYNVENYIENCLNSIIKQGLNNFEIILVNDCSIDKTKDIINKFIKNNKNIDITFIDNEFNIGAGASRNKALKVAKYDYVSFVDSDDLLSDNYYNNMLDTMKKEKASLVVCNITIVFENSDMDDITNAVCDKKHTRFGFINTGMAASPCNKIFLKSELLKFPFPEGIMNEDIATVIAVMATTKKIVYEEDSYYFYIQRENSVQNSPLSEKKFDIFTSLNILKDRISYVKDFKKYWDALVFQQVIMFFIYVPAKDNRLFYRAKFLKEFYKRSKDMNLRQNIYYYNSFIPSQGKKHRIYYKTLMKLNCNGFSLITSFLISLYNILKAKKDAATVIKNNIYIEDLIDCAKRQSRLKSDIKISVVIPNYNYDRFLYQRLYSILYQTEKIDEVIILDDCSTDDSRNTIINITNKLKDYIDISYYFNEKNSGFVFKQWKKGIELAKGDYIWIAEADDYCDKKFLKYQRKMLKKDKDISISYVDTAFIDKKGSIILKTIKPEIDILKTRHWDKSFVDDGNYEIENYAYLNCTIANVSSVLIKNIDYSDCFKELVKFKQVGDWYFYLNAMSKGKISFCNKPLNYYRVHGNNVTSVTKKQAHFDEIKKLHNYLNEKLHFTKKQEKNIKDRYKFLRKVWEVK